MAYLCKPPHGGAPVTIENPRRAVAFAERGYLVTDLDHVEPAEDEKPAPKPKPRAKAAK